MITHLNGKLIEKNPTNVIVECAGVGYFVKISLTTFSSLSSEENIKIYTQQIIREDAHTLYGFSSIEERDVFNLLISVSGIGPNTARMMLSSISPLEIQEAIIKGDVPLVQRIKGIGPKSAQRLILELQDKLKKEGPSTLLSAPINNTSRDEALSALVMLGFNKNAADKAIDTVMRTAEGTISVELIIKAALKSL
jgi:Holliday junction DNA helicase RuvA